MIVINVMLLCMVDISNSVHPSAATHVIAVKAVARPPTADADMSSDGEEFCDSFDMSGFNVRLTAMISCAVFLLACLPNVVKSSLKCYFSWSLHSFRH